MTPCSDSDVATAFLVYSVILDGVGGHGKGKDEGLWSHIYLVLNPTTKVCTENTYLQMRHCPFRILIYE
jgi:hypothetical protein